ncbi:TorD/DmsD family molecular chaperone [Thiosulfativibrio zosterae]|uniref:Chaperone TorD n=1 Tax=Thiosulfativibrio zosterae TaxID=2675053 RepID=A0A6F8PMJ3_9GAMM|nr:molecular chaperone TorD family protein [Thiosulfativibrio zosterae]BBP43333.1 chaperone TorD [Thiosulfativibrio zosterae]
MSEKIQELIVLSGLLGEPCEESMEAIQELAPQLTWLSNEAVAEIENLPLERWQMEHTRLFISGHPKTECAPFESVWAEGRMMGETTHAIQSLYNKVNYKPDAELPADYLGSELEFLAFVLENYGEQEVFLVEILEHLHTWIPKFAKAIRIHSDLAFYRDYAKRLEALFEMH